MERCVDRRGFTLVELLVVIGIIAILAAIMFPVFAAARNAGCRAACASNLRQISSAYRLYLSDNNEFYPSNDMGANLFLVEPYLGQRRFKLSGGGLDTSVWLCKAANGKLGLWYRVSYDNWGTPQKAPWWKMGIHENTCRVWNSYCVNDDVTSTTRNGKLYPAHVSKVSRSSQIVFFGEACYNENRRGNALQLGTAPTATHPSSSGGEEVTSGWYPGWPPNDSKKAKSDLQAWHNNGANFLYVDGHVMFLTAIPGLEHWKVR